MSLKTRIQRIEERIRGPGNIPREELCQVLIDDGSIDVDAEADRITKRFEEKYGGSDELIFIIVKNFSGPDLF